jgi:hypothetical protein
LSFEIKGQSGSKSEARAKGKIKLIPFLVLRRARDRDAEIETERCTGNEEPHSGSDALTKSPWDWQDWTTRA